MKWHREIDYHGNRSYLSERAGIGPASLTIAWLAAIIREKLRKSATRPAFSEVAVRARVARPHTMFPTEPEAADVRRHQTSRLRHEN